MKATYEWWQGISKVARISIIVCGIVLSWCVGFSIWAIRGWADCGLTFVTNRPDLTTDADLEEWAKVHAEDFIPLQKVQNLKISITQGCLAPAPDSLVAQFNLPSPDLKEYLEGKKLLSDPVESIVSNERERGVDYYGYPHNKLSWWPPKQEPTLKIYQAKSAFSERYYVLVETDTGTLTILSTANRGR